jgi:DNA-binding MarR family transcriptional regulator
MRRGAATGALRDQLVDDTGDVLDLGQVDTMEALTSHGPCRVSELGEILRVDVSSATRAVDRLERAGLARRERTEGDARGVRVLLTEAGAQRRATLAARRAAAMDAVLSGFDPDERAALADLLERVVAGMDSATTTLGPEAAAARSTRAAAAARRAAAASARAVEAHAAEAPTDGADGAAANGRSRQRAGRR